MLSSNDWAGLFTAVVTAFVIESHQWLSEGPCDKTVLSQLSAYLTIPTRRSVFPISMHSQRTEHHLDNPIFLF
ncbi:hypothetical protein C8J56DRAFT_352641 [Mycena floridula]|nr:hypothetical protein C8J56DRAFT_352641 [Mycena floridula]